MKAIVAHPDQAFGEAIARLLTTVEGWRVFRVSNGGEAVRTALLVLPQLVMLEPDLQGMNGAATIASLRAHGITCPVVALVTRGDVACEHWKAQGYAGAIPVSHGLDQVVPRLHQLLD